MRTYVVYCHPVPESFTSAVRRHAVEALQHAGHEVRVSDLYGDDFEPVMPLQEWREYFVAHPEPASIAPYAASLRWCEALVLIYPTWWSGPPAMLKGWLDRVVQQPLRNVRRLVIVTSHGSSRLVNAMEGQAGRRMLARGVRARCSPFARTTWLAMYGIDRSSAVERDAFLRRVDRRLSRL